MEKLEVLHTVVGMQDGTTGMEKNIGVPQKLKTELSCDHLSYQSHL